MNVEIPPDVRDTAARLGAGVPYALKVLAGRLADDPDMGEPSGLPGILSVAVDGDMFEDCPDFSVGYVREPDRIQFRYLGLTKPTEPDPDTHEHDQDQGQDQDQDQPADTAAAAVTVREIADAWHRIVRRLQDKAPDSYAALRAGAEPAAVAALEGDLGIRIPLELHVLWLMTAGDDGVNGWGCLPGNRTLMPLDAVAATYRLNMDVQAHQDTLNANRPVDGRITFWKPTWIPVLSFGPADHSSGMYLDAATGFLGCWSRYNDDPGEELDTLVTYLEEAADMLEAPTLATRDKPGLIGGTLVWLSSVGPTRKDHWQPLNG
ncbi:hypothetical protein C3492_28705 [Streptomyces sp. Ru62]|uniref:hypothetical protein n=1 Tax=Streptomyces sp. Ru62 TaxID=2080745 RepID=UPI000CDDA020|nr:hypothetical protein [Streptomyces sp. Ru62]POX60133.1 hypothetical protein C3492_28705 [Streptomyces sp. Ru62]